MAEAGGLLEGLRVLDCSLWQPGQYAAQLLCDLGAEVIKVEPPGGDRMRGLADRFFTVNSHKRSVVADLKTEAGVARVLELADEAEVLIECFRTGVAVRLGIGFEQLSARNPALVYCSISGYGQSGPRADEAGHDINYIGSTGVLDLQPGPLDRPVVPPMLVADIAGGSFPAVINILLALRARDQSGQGCHLDIAMTDAMFTFAWYAMALGAAAKFPKPGEMWLVGSSPRYQLYPTKDGRIVACGAIEQKFWDSFTTTIGLAAELADDKRNPTATRDAAAKLIAARTADEWRPILAAADCCATIVTPLEEAMRDPHFVGRGLFKHKIDTVSGKTITALPVPVAPAFRRDPN